MGRPFQNWSRTVLRQPARWHRPSREADVVQAVREARDEGLRVRASGSRHSWSDLASSDGVVQLDLGRMDRVVALGPDQVTVEAGTTLTDLTRVLARHDRTLPVLGSITAQTVAGAIATGTHGSSLIHGCLSDHVLGLHLVNGHGDVVVFDAGDPRLDGARLSLGRLGVLTQVTLRTMPATALQETRTRLPLEDAAQALLHALEDAPYAKVWWLPGQPHALLYRYTPVAHAPPVPHWRPWVDRAANEAVFPALLRLGALVPAAIPSVNALVDAVHLTPGTRQAGFADALTVPMPPRHRETEWAVPVARADEAWAVLRDLVRDRPLDFIAELRAVPRSPAWLAPSHDGPMLHLGVYATTAPWADAVFDEAAQAFLALGGRPHWGKEGATHAHRAVWTALPAFRALVTALDPDGVLAHARVDGALGSEGPDPGLG